ncbi:protein FAM110B-like [Xyrauchen texanus]|uniref:protein FAM110B-like n=1 Tax=Xyrauchen texanus TaxID=154827 RepID=UPI002242A4F6|nr:protein FAM110B-like [Xyrauchen texanus]
MKPLTPIGSPSPLRLLNKGPDYLRRQMDAGSRGHSISAVERLEADKAKYVKSQQVINTKQEPVLVPCATPPPLPRRNFTVSSPSTPVLPHRRPSVPFSSLVFSKEENEDDSKKENCQNVTVVETHNRNNATKPPAPSHRTPTTTPLVAPHSAPIMRRSNGKRMLRPDSLVIYRQKKECKSPSSCGRNVNMEAKGYSFVRRLFQSSMREKSNGSDSAHKMVINEEKGSSSRDGDSRMSWSNDKDTVDGGNGTRRSSRSEREDSMAEPHNDNTGFVEKQSKNSMMNCVRNSVGNCNNNDMDPWKPVLPRMRSDLKHSKSDVQLRCSLAMSEQERFFGFCGLDLDMVERLGPEKFLAGTSSVDTLSLLLRSVGGGGGSEPSEFSRHSGEGLFQEELTEQIPTGVSIIERNARVIKWLYGCRNAAQEGPKESTV